MSIATTVLSFGVFAAILGILSDFLCVDCSGRTDDVVSFIAGLSITYIFLQLLPDFYFNIPESAPYLIIFVLIGFTSLHVIEKYIFQHERGKRLRRDLREEHAITLGVEHFLGGMILLSFFQQGFMKGVLFFVPLISFVMVSNISVHHFLHSENRHVHFPFIVKVFHSSLVLFGVIVSLLFNFSVFVNLALIGLITGTLLFTVIREFVPEQKKGNSLYFLFGTLLYGVIIAASWVI